MCVEAELKALTWNQDQIRQLPWLLEEDTRWAALILYLWEKAPYCLENAVEK
jgi:hypothetical protein